MPAPEEPPISPTDLSDIDKFFRQNKEEALRVAFTYLRNTADAEDAVCMAFRTTIDRWQTLGVSSRTGFLFRCIDLHCRNLRRRRAHESQPPQNAEIVDMYDAHEVAKRSVETPETIIIASECYAKILAAINGLPYLEQQVARLDLIDLVSPTEGATKIGIEQQRYYRLRAKMRAFLTRHLEPYLTK